MGKPTQSSNEKYFYEIVQGVIKRIFEKYKLKTDRGELRVEVSLHTTLSEGSRVFISNGEPANGIFKLVNDPVIISLRAENGIVKDVKRKFTSFEVALIVLAVALIGVFFYLFSLFA